MALLRDGRLVCVGPPGEVLTRETLREVFGVEAEVLTARDGALAVVARSATPRDSAQPRDDDEVS